MSGKGGAKSSGDGRCFQRVGGKTTALCGLPECRDTAPCRVRSRLARGATNEEEGEEGEEEEAKKGGSDDHAHEGKTERKGTRRSGRQTDDGEKSGDDRRESESESARTITSRERADWNGYQWMLLVQMCNDLERALAELRAHDAAERERRREALATAAAAAGVRRERRRQRSRRALSDAEIEREVTQHVEAIALAADMRRHLENLREAAAEQRREWFEDERDWLEVREQWRRQHLDKAYAQLGDGKRAERSGERQIRVEVETRRDRPLAYARKLAHRNRVAVYHKRAARLPPGAADDMNVGETSDAIVSRAHSWPQGRTAEQWAQARAAAVESQLEVEDVERQLLDSELKRAAATAALVELAKSARDDDADADDDGEGKNGDAEAEDADREETRAAAERRARIVGRVRAFQKELADADIKFGDDERAEVATDKIAWIRRQEKRALHNADGLARLIATETAAASTAVATVPIASRPLSSPSASASARRPQLLAPAPRRTPQR